jgi:hypothetical protein
MLIEDTFFSFRYSTITYSFKVRLIFKLLSYEKIDEIFVYIYGKWDT